MFHFRAAVSLSSLCLSCLFAVNSLGQELPLTLSVTCTVRIPSQLPPGSATPRNNELQDSGVKEPSPERCQLPSSSVESVRSWHISTLSPDVLLHKGLLLKGNVNSYGGCKGKEKKRALFHPIFKKNLDLFLGPRDWVFQLKAQQKQASILKMPHSRI